MSALPDPGTQMTACISGCLQGSTDIHNTQEFTNTVFTICILSVDLFAKEYIVLVLSEAKGIPSMYHIAERLCC